MKKYKEIYPYKKTHGVGLKPWYLFKEVDRTTHHALFVKLISDSILFRSKFLDVLKNQLANKIETEEI